MVLNTWEIAVICVEAGALVVILISCALSRIKARLCGIIRTRFPVYPVRFAVELLCAAALGALCVISLTSLNRYSSHIEDMKQRGLAAVADYENTTVEDLYGGSSIEIVDKESFEVFYIEHETEHFQSLAEDARRNATVFGAHTLVVLAVTLAGSGAFVTRRGVLFFCSLKLLPVAAEVKNDRVLVFVNGDRKKPLMKLRATNTNRKHFSEFMADGKPSEKLHEILDDEE